MTKLSRFLAGVIVLLVISSVTISNHSLDDSNLVSDLSSEVKSLERANTILKAKVAQSGSLTSMVEKIEHSGYIEPDNIATLNAPGQVALR